MSTGDTSAILNVTSSGNYSATVTDSAGNSFSIYHFPVQFDSIQQVVLNDEHTCQSSIQLNQSAPGATTYCGSETPVIYVGPNGYFSTNVIPDTMLIWVMEQTSGGCRTSDTAFIFFDNCTAVQDLSKDANLLIIRSSENTLNIETISGKNIDHVYIYDLTGKIFNSQSCNKSSVEINTPSLSHGLYLLKCSVDGEMVIRKVFL
ncbi:MAG: T9SS type A sorting domain-containing protein [Bacteroidetes bacterium]|nr:T9SS type A sorting domain-containing protein [Bacteroidota bacterium]